MPCRETRKPKSGLGRQLALGGRIRRQLVEAEGHPPSSRPAKAQVAPVDGELQAGGLAAISSASSQIPGPILPPCEATRSTGHFGHT
jgi:hypothetical protein